MTDSVRWKVTVTFDVDAPTAVEACETIDGILNLGDLELPNCSMLAVRAEPDPVETGES